MAFLQTYLTIFLYVFQAIAILFAAVSFLILVLSLCDMTFALGWGYNWVTTIVALVQVAIGLAIRKITVLALKRIR
jgi:hypothetical protein